MLLKHYFPGTEARWNKSGLAITKELLENMHGKISVESQPGLGRCFTISLPCTE